MIPTLCVRQPHAELIARGIKLEEIRSWPPPKILERRRVLIVASRSWSYGARDLMAKYKLTEADCPRGVAVCTVRVLGAQKTDHGYCEEACCDVTDFDLAWGLEGAKRTPNVPIAGRLMVFQPTEAELAALRAAKVIR